MKKLSLGMVLAASLTAAVAEAQVVAYHNVECWAEGNKFRVNGASPRDYLTSSRLFLNVKAKDNKAALTSYAGHVSGQKFVEGRTQMTEASFYNTFFAADVVHEAVLSPRATAYPDAKYWRFKDFNAQAGVSLDGGGMYGTLVVAKTAGTPEAAEKTFDAHYTFQHGDHTGGTIDFVCVGKYIY